MRWALFQQVMQKLAEVRELDPQRDASAYAEHLLFLHPELFARIDGGPQSVRARMAARTIAVDHLREIKRLPQYVDELERSLAVSTMSPASRLVRVTALAYILVHHGSPGGSPGGGPSGSSSGSMSRTALHGSERMPAGFAMLDDCIALCGAKLATPGRHAPGALGRMLVAELLRIRYLGLALPREALATCEAALTHSAQLAARARGLANHTLERAVLQIVQQPPQTFPAELLLPEQDDPIEIEGMLHLVPAELVEYDADTLVFEFTDGTRLRRGVDGTLSEA